MSDGSTELATLTEAMLAAAKAAGADAAMRSPWTEHRYRWTC
jgi:hypothetical protein